MELAVVRLGEDASTSQGVVGSTVIFEHAEADEYVAWVCASKYGRNAGQFVKCVLEGYHIRVAFPTETVPSLFLFARYYAKRAQCIQVSINHVDWLHEQSFEHASCVMLERFNLPLFTLETPPLAQHVAKAQKPKPRPELVAVADAEPGTAEQDGESLESMLSDIIGSTDAHSEHAELEVGEIGEEQLRVHELRASMRVLRESDFDDKFDELMKKYGGGFWHQ